VCLNCGQYETAQESWEIFARELLCRFEVYWRFSYGLQQVCVCVLIVQVGEEGEGEWEGRGVGGLRIQETCVNPDTHRNANIFIYL